MNDEYTEQSRESVSGVLEEITIDEVRECGRRVCVIPVGSTEPHGPALPFACPISVPTFMSVLEDLMSMCEAEGVRRIVVVNGHGGNTDVIRAVQRDLAASAGGVARKASAEKGRRVVESSVEGLAEFLVRISGEPDSPMFPY